MNTTKAIARFWKMVTVIDHPDGCWIWNGSQSNGYGQMRVNRIRIQAHHFALLHFNGLSVPGGYEVDHICRIHSCVNPAHLRIVTHAVNQTGLYKDYCKQGHRLSGDNLHIGRSGRRVCRQCRRDTQARFHANHPELKWYNDRRK